MKKIYKPLAVAAFALMANVAFGQNLKVTADGQPVADGDVLDLPYEFDDSYSDPGSNFYYLIYTWDPKLEASTTSGTATLTVTLTSVDNTTNFQLCWPSGCQAAQPGKSVSASDPISTTPVDLKIHKEDTFYTVDGYPTDGGTARVKFECGSETMEITINAILADKNGVGENFADSNEPTVYYTLEGIKVENPTKGIFVARKGGKAKLVHKK